MTRKFAALSALVAATALAATAGFAAVSAAPDPAQMALLAGDIPGSKVKGKRLKPDKGYVAAYARDFELTKPYGSSQLIFISSEVHLASAAKTTIADMANFRTFLRSPQGRQLIATSFAKEFGTTLKKKDVTISKLRTPAIGDEAVLVSLAVRTKQGRIYAAFTWFRVDRTLSALAVVGLRPTGPASVAKLGGMVVAHVGQQFTPVSSLPPTITGTPVQGQTLTASTGTFSMTPTYTYAWQRCDAAGAACTDIVGATAPTYLVATEDVATTLRVSVTATNRFGTATHQSVQTAVVT
jgi:hypothetical protein